MRQQRLAAILDGLNAVSADILASVMISEDGLAMAGSLRQRHDQDAISVLSAVMVHLGYQAMEHFIGGELEQVSLKSKAGHFLAIPTCRNMIVTVLARPQADVEFIFSEMKRVADSIDQVFDTPAEGSR